MSDVWVVYVGRHPRFSGPGYERLPAVRVRSGNGADDANSGRFLGPNKSHLYLPCFNLKRTSYLLVELGLVAGEGDVEEEKRRQEGDGRILESARVDGDEVVALGGREEGGLDEPGQAQAEKDVERVGTERVAQAHRAVTWNKEGVRVRSTGRTRIRLSVYLV